MNAVTIAIMVLLGVFVVFAFCKIARINNRIDDIYNKAFIMQGEIEANTARAKDNYKLIAQVNTELESVKNSITLHKHEPTDEPQIGRSRVREPCSRTRGRSRTEQCSIRTICKTRELCPIAQARHGHKERWQSRRSIIFDR